MRNAPSSLRLLGALCLATAAFAGTATAKPFRPPPPPDGGALVPQVPASAVDSIQASPTLTAHIESRAAGIGACMQYNRATFVRARASIRWDRRGHIVAARMLGGSAAFNRCGSRALRGMLAGVAARGSGWAKLIVRRTAAPVRPPVIVPAPPKPVPPVIRPAPTPTPPVIRPRPAPAAIDLQSCQVDSDCTLHFRLHACVAGDPVAVNKLDPAAVSVKFPVTHHACAMGGPQYDQLRMSNENRWSARCEQARCTVHDAGPQKHPLGF